jgi:CDP-paratose 2-epimerase
MVETMKILVTGSGGLIGGEAVAYFDALGHQVVGVDNNMRKTFFGDGGDVQWNIARIFHHAKNFNQQYFDIRDVAGMNTVFSMFGPFDAIIHCAAQPSHDFATAHQDLDYSVNVSGTKRLLEVAAQYSPGAVFIFMSTNKVYDDAVNAFPAVEFERVFAAPQCPWDGFNETTPVGASNVFGQHKAEAEQLVLSYKDKLRTVVLRGGCLTGPGHSGVTQHGFLSYLLKCAITGTPYTIYGYGGKQVRDNIHSYDVCRAFDEIIKAPRSGEIYNIGGGYLNSCSILEAIELIEKITGRTVKTSEGSARSADHKLYITDMMKFRTHYPNWRITKPLTVTLSEMAQVEFWGRYSDHKDTYEYPLTDKSVVMDVGGFRGAWSQAIFDKYQPYIFLYEPIAEFAEACRYRFKTNDKVFVRQYGLSAADNFVTAKRQGQNSSFIREKMPHDKTHGEPVEEKIEIVDICRALRTLPNGDIDLASFNCEGAEYEALERLISTGDIARFRHVQIQFHNFFAAAPATRDRIRENLKKTHTEMFNYPWTWEAWKRNDQP